MCTVGSDYEDRLLYQYENLFSKVLNAKQLCWHDLCSTKCSSSQKLKSQKGQLESKGLHIQLLRKKVSELEEEKRSRSALAVERDDAHLEARRLQRKLERLQGELKATRLSNTELKAQLSHTIELKVEGRGVQVQTKSRGIFTS